MCFGYIVTLVFAHDFSRLVFLLTLQTCGFTVYRRSLWLRSCLSITEGLFSSKQEQLLRSWSIRLIPTQNVLGVCLMIDSSPLHESCAFLYVLFTGSSVYLMEIGSTSELRVGIQQTRRVLRWGTPV